MKIIKGDTPGFDNYQVFTTQIVLTYPNSILFWRPVEESREVEIRNVIEADDKTGQVAFQVENEKGELLFTNGVEEIALSNEVKVLILFPPMKEAFLRAGFKPKIIQTYEKGLKIINKNPTVSVVVEVQQELAAGGVESQ